jgi:hypothetical protein
VAAILEMTGCRTLSEFYDLTNPLERRLIIKSIEAYNEEKSSSTGGSGASPSPMGGPPAGL